MRLVQSAFVLFGAVCAAADNSLETTLARMDRAARDFKSLRADIQKVAHTEVIKLDSVDAGTIVVKRGPKLHDMRMLIDIQPPDAKKALIAGANLDIYYPKYNTIQQWDFGKNKDLVYQFMLLGFGGNSRDLQDAYSIKLGGPETVAGEKTTRIELVPKSKELLAHFKKFELWISDEKGITLQQKMHQSGGDYILNTYTNVKVNPSLSDSDLKLNVPKDAKRERPQK
jgi:outer membrane lipoprotein-sorting protein